MFGPSSILLVFLGCALALTVPSRSLDVITTARLAYPHLAAEAKQFGEFAVEYKRNYKTRDEILTRFSLFVENLEKIKRQNEEAKGVTIYGITEFTDWSWPEFRAKMLITGKPEFNMTNFPRRSVPQNRDHPENWDWRVSGIVTGVKNQGGCGSCWAFATAAVVESMNAKAGRGLIELAEQQMVDCIEGGCQGGVLAHSFGYAQDHGLPTEGDYPYRGEKGQCHDANIAVKLSQMYILPNDEESIAYSITDGGPAALGFKVGEAWMNYKGGVITSTDCDNENPEKWHANEAIGYGVEGGTPYWLLKNSWGTGWGDGGFVKVRRGSNWCQITSMPVGGGIW